MRGVESKRLPPLNCARTSFGIMAVFGFAHQLEISYADLEKALLRYDDRLELLTEPPDMAGWEPMSRNRRPTPRSDDSTSHRPRSRSGDQRLPRSLSRAWDLGEPPSHLAEHMK